jgi:hypothetical protein
MLNSTQRKFILFLVVLGLIAGNVVTLVALNEAKANLEVVKENAVNELIECGCEGYWRGVPYAYNSRDVNLGGLTIPFK